MPYVTQIEIEGTWHTVSELPHPDRGAAEREAGELVLLVPFSTIHVAEIEPLGGPQDTGRTATTTAPFERPTHREEAT